MEGRSIHLLQSLGTFIAEFDKDGIGFHRLDDLSDLNNQPTVSISMALRENMTTSLALRAEMCAVPTRYISAPLDGLRRND